MVVSIEPSCALDRINAFGPLCSGNCGTRVTGLLVIGLDLGPWGVAGEVAKVKSRIKMLALPHGAVPFSRDAALIFP